MTVVDPDKEFPGLKQNIDYLRVDYIRERSYEFDHVYGPTQPTDTVFQEAVEPLIGPVLDGQNVTIFAYGQTGSGKTHTMLGHRGDRGVIQMALAKLFNEQKEHTRVTVSFVELYNEEIHDLLIDEERRYGNHNGVGGLDLREDPIKGPCIAGVTEMPASDVETVMALLRADPMKKLEQQVRVRNGVIRKLVGQLKKDGIGARTIVRNSYAGRASPSYAKKNSPRRESYASPQAKSSGIMADLLGAASPSFEPHPATFSASQRKVPRRPDDAKDASGRRRRPRVAA